MVSNHQILIAGSFAERFPFGLRSIGDKLSSYTEPSKIANLKRRKIDKVAKKHETSEVGVVVGDKIIGETNLAKAYVRAVKQKATAMRARAELRISVLI